VLSRVIHEIPHAEMAQSLPKAVCSQSMGPHNNRNNAFDVRRVCQRVIDVLNHECL